jgi:hypothetical protein
MTKGKALLSGALGAAVVFGAAALTQKPAQNIDAHSHPNLAEAQQHIVQAYQKIDEAQKMNKDELGGHAEKGQAVTGSGRSGIQASSGIR